jgi:hypothetical protein
VYQENKKIQIKNPATKWMQGPSISFVKRIEGKGRGETGGRTYGET